MKVGSDLQEKMLCSRYAACMALNAANFRSASATLPYMPLLPAWQPALLPLTPPSRPPCMHCTSSQPRFRGESIHQLNYDLTRKLRRTQLALPHHMNVAMHGHAPPMNLRLAAALPPNCNHGCHPTAQPASYRTLPAPLSAATPTSPSPSTALYVCSPAATVSSVVFVLTMQHASVVYLPHSPAPEPPPKRESIHLLFL